MLLYGYLLLDCCVCILVFVVVCFDFVWYFVVVVVLGLFAADCVWCLRCFSFGRLWLACLFWFVSLVSRDGLFYCLFGCVVLMAGLLVGEVVMLVGAF